MSESPIAITDFNVVAATFGGFAALYALGSDFVTERLYLSEPMLSLLIGVAFSPHGANFIKPLEYASGSDSRLIDITLNFTRIVLDIQLVICGIQLPPKYLFRRWKSLAMVLGPGMLGMWLISSLLIWAMVPDIYFVHAMVVAACITPTDPVLSNGIVKGSFAEKHLSPDLRNLIVSESGTNDGLGYPFLDLGIFLLQYAGGETADRTVGVRTGIGIWFKEAWAHQIILGAAIGACIGWISKELVYAAYKVKTIDRESFLMFPLLMALFIMGTCGLVNTDDILASFIAGNFFTLDAANFFNTKINNDKFHDILDTLLNLAIFFWLGAVCPWDMFYYNSVIPLWRLVILGILILLFRRVPVIFTLSWFLDEITSWQDTLFTGYFGPIGISAMYYLHITLPVLHGIEERNPEREDIVQLIEVLTIVVWFITICSIFAHGLSITVGKGSFFLARPILEKTRFGRQHQPQPTVPQDNA